MAGQEAKIPDDGKKEESSLGCTHYKRKCAFITPCCDKEYTCRLCHNEAEAHEVNRRLVRDVRCLICRTQQAVQKTCVKCETVFGNYYCSICRLFDDTDKKQFHCDPCGICRIGGRDNFYHCERCDMCLAVSIRNSHKCVEKASRSNCPVCMEDLHTSLLPAHIPPCGHLLHQPCYKEMLRTGNYACPLCGESMLDLKDYWKQLDEEIGLTPMPESYRTMRVQILCRDCHKETRTLFHIIGLKCLECGSYNTCRAAEPEGAQDGIPLPETAEELELPSDDDEGDSHEGVDSDFVVVDAVSDDSLSHDSCPDDVDEDMDEEEWSEPAGERAALAEGTSGTSADCSDSTSEPAKSNPKVESGTDKLQQEENANVSSS